ncbi:8-oxo-dGDP phosphatase NUDT18 [Aplysia californica]|uniref:8-oxo-dGDP phosphatase NUDT18 n=1 Tax=Aplysia californica TaxID=6500 RepID=A0ABM0JWF4_APLCA|nr:8-oxo-dGDP phosphatase NUDT18 [Aplysia californica]
MSDIEHQIKAIQNGMPVSVEKRLDIAPEEEMTFIPMTKMNICYICCSILFDDQGRVLMIQEAKKSCHGLWYLPAGRLEPGETLLDGAKREVLEESGLTCDLTALIAVEINGTWQRFTFTGKITGGKLKTTNEKDEESLQAKFFSDEEIKTSRESFRAGDVIKLIDAGRKYYAKESSLRNPDVLPVISPHRLQTHRVVILDRSCPEKATMHVLASEEGGLHIPSSINFLRKRTSIAVSVFALLKDAFVENLTAASIRMCGILGLEHRGTGEQEDGLCITSLVCLDLGDTAAPPTPASSKYQWCQIKDTQLQDYLSKGSKGALVPLL